MNKVKQYLFDVRLWILVLFLIRLENINLPPLDEHSWRQSITLGVARNYLEWDANFFHPRTVICDSRGGIQAQEFPFFNYCIFLLWKVFGQHNWCYRLFNLLVASIGLLYFEKIARRLTDERSALAATVLFATSVAFMYARKGMPDVFAVSLAIMGTYFGWRYWESRKNKDLLGFGLLVGLGLLCKMPAACVLGFLVWPVVNPEVSWRSKIKWCLVGALSVVPLVLWYFKWVPWAEKTYQFPLFYPNTLEDGFQQLCAMCVNTYDRFFTIALKSRISFGLSVIGLGYVLWNHNRPVLWSFVASFSLLFFFMLKAGAVFAGHVYYVIPFVPMMALLAGYALAHILRNDWLIWGALVALATNAIYTQKHDFFIAREDKKYIRLEQIVDAHVPKNARILVNNRSGSPIMMYAAHRVGWTVDDRMKDAEWVRGESTVGMEYLVIERSRWNDPLPFKLLYEDPDFRVYKVKE